MTASEPVDLAGVEPHTLAVEAGVDGHVVALQRVQVEAALGTLHVVERPQRLALFLAQKLRLLEGQLSQLLHVLPGEILVLGARRLVQHGLPIPASVSSASAVRIPPGSRPEPAPDIARRPGWPPHGARLGAEPRRARIRPLNSAD